VEDYREYLAALIRWEEFLQESRKLQDSQREKLFKYVTAEPKDRSEVVLSKTKGGQIPCGATVAFGDIGLDDEFMKEMAKAKQVINREIEITAQLRLRDTMFKEFIKAIGSSESGGQDRRRHLLPSDIYIDTDDDQTVEQVKRAIARLSRSVGLESFFEFEPETGSWLRRSISGFMDALTQTEVQDRLQLIEHGLKTALIEKHQAEADKNKASAASEIINALKEVPNASILLGSVLITKVTTDGEAQVHVLTLNATQLAKLQQGPELLKSPQAFIGELGLLKAETSQ